MTDLKYVVDNCIWRKTLYDVAICRGNASPCSVAIANGKCDTIKDYLERERSIYDGKRFNNETIG